MKLLNAFTPAMLPGFPSSVEFFELTDEQARLLVQKLGGIESCVGHQGAADLYAARLGVPVPMNRVSVRLQDGETALLGQYTGPRLPEGRTLTAEEFEAAGVRWLLVVHTPDSIARTAASAMDHGLYLKSLPPEVSQALGREIL